jgi:flagellar basal-body rod protein FlgF
MDRAAFTAMTGAKNALDLLGVTSNNLANAGASGFREQMAFFRTVPLEGEGAPTRAFAVGWTPYAKLSPGVLEATNNPFNAAIDGPGWFVALNADGTEALTRSGTFKVLDGKLCFVDGKPVVGVAGPILVPPGGQIDFAEDGTVNLKLPTNPVTIQPLGRLKLVNPRPQSLIRDPDGSFSLVNDRKGKLKQVDSISVRGRFLESSNVSTANSMLHIITQSRAFDMNMKMVQTVSENDKAANSLISRAR